MQGVAPLQPPGSQELEMCRPPPPHGWRQGREEGAGRVEDRTAQGGGGEFGILGAEGDC